MGEGKSLKGMVTSPGAAVPRVSVCRQSFKRLLTLSILPARALSSPHSCVITAMRPLGSDPYRHWCNFSCGYSSKLDSMAVTSRFK